MRESSSLLPLCLVFYIGIGAGCKEPAPARLPPLNLQPALSALSPKLKSLSPQSLCTSEKLSTELQALEYDWLKTATQETSQPGDYTDIRILSLIAAQQLRTRDPNYRLNKFVSAAAVRFGFIDDHLHAHIGPDTRIHVWNIGVPEEPRRIGRFPACSPSDFNALALKEAPSIALPNDFILSESTHYLNLSSAHSNPTWSSLVGSTQFPALSLPPAPQITRSQTGPIRDSTSRELKLLTFNTALLNYKIFGVIPIRTAPNLDERRRAILDSVFLHDDILALQELWDPQEGHHFGSEAQKRGFNYFDPVKAHASNGLGLAIRTSLIDPAYPITHNVFTFTESLSKEYWAAELTSLGLSAGIKRGFQLVSFQTRDGQSVSVINTHFTAYRENWRIRLAQAKQLAAVARTLESDLVILMGDLNGDIHYAADTYTNPAGDQSHNWIPNAYSTPLLAANGHLDDWSTIGFGPKFIDACYSLRLEDRDSRCNPTWDHTNTVVHAQYPTPSEPQGRLDFILGRSKRTIHSVASASVFDSVVRLSNGKQSHMSDHMGVRVKLRYSLQRDLQP